MSPYFNGRTPKLPVPRRRLITALSAVPTCGTLTTPAKTRVAGQPFQQTLVLRQLPQARFRRISARRGPRALELMA